MGSAFDFLVEAFKHVRAFEMLMMLARQAVEGEGFFDCFLDPVDELLIPVFPFGDPCGQVSAGLLDVSPVIEPAQLLQAVVVGLARKMVQGVSEEVHVASLHGRLREDLADGRAKAGVIVGDDELDAAEAAAAQGEQEVLPGGAALAVGHVDGQDLAPPVPVDADRDQHRLARDHAALAHLFIAAVEDEVGEGLGKGARGEGVEASERGSLLTGVCEFIPAWDRCQLYRCSQVPIR